MSQKIQKIIMIFSLALFMSGCMNSHNYYVHHNNKLATKDNTAIILGIIDSGWEKEFEIKNCMSVIDKIDDVKFISGSGSIEVLPGEHSFTTHRIYHIDALFYRAIEETYTANFIAGGVYTFDCTNSDYARLIELPLKYNELEKHKISEFRKAGYRRKTEKDIEWTLE